MERGEHKLLHPLAPPLRPARGGAGGFVLRGLKTRYPKKVHNIFPQRALWFKALVLFSALWLPSCATAPAVQPQVNSFVVAERFDSALRILEKHKDGYGRNNELLFWLDKGLVLHLAGRYEESIKAFEEAKVEYDQLYTQSLSKLAATWAYNDYSAPYRGEDFERVMLNIFQGLNFAVLGDCREALVEARDVDSILYAINEQYPDGKKNVYREDAFARFLMGLLYECAGSASDANDAYISYQKALEAYESDYRQHYQMDPPPLLIENLLSLAHRFDPAEFKRLKSKYSPGGFPSREERDAKAEVYVVHYSGLSPMKYQEWIAVPLPGGIVTKIAFPRYKERIFDVREGWFSARKGGAIVARQPTQLGEDIAGIAVKNLSDRKVRVIAKAVLRPAGKYALERYGADALERRHGDAAADAVRVSGSLYNIYSEQADLRAWQTLPAQIRVARLLLAPGEYEFFFNGEPLGTADVRAGGKKFFLIRTSR